MKQPLISVIVPVYGVEQYIGKFLESLFAQTYTNLQLIFINDGTKDRSIDILKSMLADKYQQWKEKTIIYEKENAGVAAARMDGLRLFTGDYVIQFDPDDYIEPDTMQSLAEAIEKTDADVVYFDFIIYGKKGPVYRASNEYKDCQSMMDDMIKCRSIRSLSAKCYKSAICKAQPLCAPVAAFSEDFMLNIQFMHKCKTLCYIPRAFYHYVFTRGDSQMNNLTSQARRGGVYNLMILRNLYSSDVEHSPLCNTWDYFNFHIAYHIMKGKMKDLVDAYPELRKFVLSTPLATKKKRGISLNRQIRVKLFFRINHKR